MKIGVVSGARGSRGDERALEIASHHQIDHTPPLVQTDLAYPPSIPLFPKFSLNQERINFYKEINNTEWKPRRKTHKN
ncbi:hypothetical protein C0J52_03558 [Blattella germanica]|nr:hypothetical protein C0J52_03558 [Blattella germanica]